MENAELQKIWKNIDTEINYKSKDELNLLLKSKARQTLNRYLVINSTSVIVSVGVLVWLVITSANRAGDIIYLANNVTLGVITMISLASGLFSWSKFRNSRFNMPLKEWLNDRINILSKWLTGKTGKLYLFIIPFLYILVLMSIHVYYENKSFIEVINTKESLFGIIQALPIGIIVSYIIVRKIRKYQLKNLEFLKDLYGRLCNIS